MFSILKLPFQEETDLTTDEEDDSDREDTSHKVLSTKTIDKFFTVFRGLIGAEMLGKYNGMIGG